MGHGVIWLVRNSMNQFFGLFFFKAGLPEDLSHNCIEFILSWKHTEVWCSHDLFLTWLPVICLSYKKQYIPLGWHCHYYAVTCVPGISWQSLLLKSFLYSLVFITQVCSFSVAIWHDILSWALKEAMELLCSVSPAHSNFRHSLLHSCSSLMLFPPSSCHDLSGNMPCQLVLRGGCTLFPTFDGLYWGGRGDHLLSSPLHFYVVFFLSVAVFCFVYKFIPWLVATWAN